LEKIMQHCPFQRKNRHERHVFPPAAGGVSLHRRERPVQVLPALQLAPPLLSRRLLDLQNTTGYEILQKQGQRIFGGPMPG
jgi:hypothetical protein